MGRVKLKKVVRASENKIKKSKLPDDIYVYFVDRRVKRDFGGRVGDVILARKPLTEKEVLEAADGDNFYDSPGRFPKILAGGQVYLYKGYQVDKKESRKQRFLCLKGWDKRKWVYCGMYPKIRKSHRGMGLGTYLYKCMMRLAAIHNKRMGRKRLLFMPHESQSLDGVTSDAAWGCYRSLARRGYLRNLSRPFRGSLDFRRGENTKYDLYEAIRVPKVKETVIKINKEARGKYMEYVA